jgi:integrase
MITADSTQQVAESNEAKQHHSRAVLAPSPNKVGRYRKIPVYAVYEFQPLLKKAGLPRICFHDLHYTTATLLLKQGAHPKIVSEMLGHASACITLDLYSHLLPDIQQGAIKAMEETLQNPSLS